MISRISQLFAKNTEDKWQPIIKQLEKAISPDSVIRRKEELLTYECDGLVRLV